jgi:hypothetical protein
VRFGIFALPRAQTFWASQVLTTFDAICLHEPFGHAAQWGDSQKTQNVLDSLPYQKVGFSDGYPLMEGMDFDHISKVVIWREPKEVSASFERMGVDVPVKSLEPLADMLSDLRSQPEVLDLTFPVVDESKIIELFRHCLLRKPTGAEIRKAKCKIFMPAWHVRNIMKRSI